MSLLCYVLLAVAVIFLLAGLLIRLGKLSFIPRERYQHVRDFQGYSRALAGAIFCIGLLAAISAAVAFYAASELLPALLFGVGFVLLWFWVVRIQQRYNQPAAKNK